MTLDFGDSLVIAGIVALGNVALMSARGEKRLRRLEKKVNALLKRFEVDGAPVLSEEVRRQADAGKILNAIKLLQEETDLSLKEAKQTVEDYLDWQ